MSLTIVQTPEIALAKTNKVYVNTASPFVNKFVKFDSEIIYFAEGHDAVDIQNIGLNTVHRNRHQFSIGSRQKISVVSKLKELDVVQCILSIPDDKNLLIDCEEFEYLLKNVQNGNPLSESQKVYFSYKSVSFTINIETISLVKENDSILSMLSSVPSNSGTITQNTKFMFESVKNNLKLKNKSTSVGNKLFKSNFNFSELGIGGLDSQFQTIFRSAFASRVVPKVIADKMKLKHRKGVLLYGPPGTGKTLIARKIGKVLNCKEPKIVSGPELLDKYVGGSEEKLRGLFIDAENDMKNGIDDVLHLIIFDEADALFKKRGLRNDNTGVAENIVNQILAKLDGVEELNNILVIAMTNRKDAIDEAILRSGRLDIHIEVGLPTEQGRQEILNIHASKVKDRFSPDVDLNLIANKTKNYTGAELEQLVTSATSFAITREIDISNLKNTDINPIITQQDFINAIDDVPTLFGKIADEIGLVTQTPFITWDDEIELNRNLMMTSIETLKNGNNLSFLITGSTFVGKTKFFSHLIKDLNIACVKMLSPEVMLRSSNIQNDLVEMINACNRAEISVLFIDGFERLIKWSRYGHKYDNEVLQLLMMLLRLTQKSDKKMIVFCTATESDVLQDLEIYDMFDYRWEYPNKITIDKVTEHFPQIIEQLDDSDLSEISISRIMKMIKHN